VWNFCNYIFVGEKLTAFGFVRGEYNKNFKNHCSSLKEIPKGMLPSRAFTRSNSAPFENRWNTPDLQCSFLTCVHVSVCAHTSVAGKDFLVLLLNANFCRSRWWKVQSGAVDLLFAVVMSWFYVAGQPSMVLILQKEVIFQSEFRPVWLPPAFFWPWTKEDPVVMHRITERNSWNWQQGFVFVAVKTLYQRPQKLAQAVWVKLSCFPDAME